MENSVKVFLCEDDESLGPLLADYLTEKGYDTDLFKDGEARTRSRIWRWRASMPSASIAPTG